MARNRDYLNGRARGFPHVDFHREVKNSISLTIDLRTGYSLSEIGVFSDIFGDGFTNSRNSLRDRNLMELVVSDTSSMIFEINIYKLSKFTIAELRLLSNDKFFQQNPDGSPYFIPDCISLSPVSSRSTDLEYLNFITNTPMKFPYGKEYPKMRYVVMYLNEMDNGEMVKRYLNPSPSILNRRR